MAISAARVEATPEAIHQMEHYLELLDEGSSEVASAQEILDLLQGGELAQAEHETSKMAAFEEEHMEESGQFREGEAHRDLDEHEDQPRP